jgi:hypothetical protein
VDRTRAAHFKVVAAVIAPRADYRHCVTVIGLGAPVYLIVPIFV